MRRETQSLITHYLELVQKEPKHNLDALARLKLYESFGPSTIGLALPSSIGISREQYYEYLRNRLLNYTVADRALGWLGVLSAKKVLPVWERVWQQIEVEPDLQTKPQDILEVAEKLLLNDLDLSNSVIELFCEFNIAMSIHLCVTYDVANSFKTAYYVLEKIIWGLHTLNPTLPENNQECYDRDNDFVLRALEAYSVIDPNLPGEHYAPNALPIKFDLPKRLEFWEWWLSEAIPQAWELAQQSASQNS